MTSNMLQILKDLYPLNCQNNGSGTSSTNLSINIRFSVLGAQKLLRKPKMNLQCWLRVVLWGPFLCQFADSEVLILSSFYRFGVHIVSWMFSIPSCKNLKSMNTSLPNEKENHPRRLRTLRTCASIMLLRLLIWCFSDIVGEYGQRPLYRMLGYFSIIGLLRVHVHLGDFTLALKVMDNVELNQKVRSELIIIQFSTKYFTSLPLHV